MGGVDIGDHDIRLPGLQGGQQGREDNRLIGQLETQTFAERFREIDIKADVFARILRIERLIAGGMGIDRIHQGLAFEARILRLQRVAAGRRDWFVRPCRSRRGSGNDPGNPEHNRQQAPCERSGAQEYLRPSRDFTDRASQHQVASAHRSSGRPLLHAGTMPAPRIRSDTWCRIGTRYGPQATSLPYPGQ
jgi:hypothetical protein